MQRILCIVLLFCCVVVPVTAQENEFLAQGKGTGANHNTALIAAKRDAIEKGIGIILLSPSEIENFQSKRNVILNKTVGTVKNFDIIAETKEPDGKTTVIIKTLILKNVLRKNLSAFHILIESMNKPRVMILIDENNIGTRIPGNRSAEDAIITYLKTPYGFDLIDPNVATSIKSSQQKMAELKGNLAATTALGTQYDAEVIITGSAISRTAEQTSHNLGGMVSVQADVTLNAINCTTGSIIGTTTDHATKVHISPKTAGNQAIAKAATRATGKLLETIIADWQNQLTNGITLHLTITAVATSRTKKAIFATLEELPGVGTVRERAWDGQSTQLQIDLIYKGNPNRFNSKIDGYKMKTGGGSLAVTGVNGQTITLAAQTL